MISVLNHFDDDDDDDHDDEMMTQMVMLFKKKGSEIWRHVDDNDVHQS